MPVSTTTARPAGRGLVARTLATSAPARATSARPGSIGSRAPDPASRGARAAANASGEGAEPPS